MHLSIAAKHTLSVPLRLRSIGCLAVVALGVCLPLTPAAAESLADAVAAAYETNPSLQQARNRLRNVNETYVQTRAGYGPTLTLQGTATENNAMTQSESQLLDGSVNNNAAEAALNLSQPLYTGGRLRGQLAAARSTILSGQQSLRLVEMQVIQTVIAAYASVLRDQERLKVAQENVSVLQDQLREHLARLKRDDVTITDATLADARLAAAETQLGSLLGQLEISRSQFLQIVGHNPGTLEPLPDLPGMPASSDEAYTRAEANNPQLLATKYTEQASSATVAAVRGLGKPTVTLDGQAGYTSRLEPFFSREYRRDIAARVTVTQPLFSSGAIRSRIRAAKATNDADQAAIDLTRRSALQSVTAAWSQLYAARVGLSSGTRQVQSAQTSFAGMRREQLNGQRSTLDTLNVEQELANAQFTLLQNRYNEYIARAALLAAMGELSVDKIAPGTPLYDPEADFRRVRNLGRTPLEPIAQAIDRIGSAGLRRPISADLTGANVPASDQMIPLPAQPTAREASGTLTPITKSPLVRKDDLGPDGEPVHGVLPPRPPITQEPAR